MQWFLFTGLMFKGHVFSSSELNTHPFISSYCLTVYSFLLVIYVSIKHRVVIFLLDMKVLETIDHILQSQINTVMHGLVTSMYSDICVLRWFHCYTYIMEGTGEHRPGEHRAIPQCSLSIPWRGSAHTGRENLLPAQHGILFWSTLFL